MGGGRGGGGGGGGTDLEEPAKCHADEAAAQGNIAGADPAVQQALPRPRQIPQQPLARLPPCQSVSLQHRLANQASITREGMIEQSMARLQPKNKCAFVKGNHQLSKLQKQICRSTP